MSKQEIHCLIQVCSDKPKWLLCAVYASNSSQLCTNIWESLMDLHDTFNIPWLIRGDFNNILYSREKFGGLPFNVNRVEKFANCIAYCKLIGLGFRGSRFT